MDEVACGGLETAEKQCAFLRDDVPVGVRQRLGDAGSLQGCQAL